MKLQKHLAYEYKEKKHYKYVVVIPEELVNQLGWKQGRELESEIKGDGLILRMKGSAGK